MLHAAELERRDRDEVELAERVRNRGVALEKLERARVQIEDRLAIARHLGGVGFAMEHPERAAVALGGLDLEVAGDERHEIGRQRLRFRERHRDAIAARSVRDSSAPFAADCHFAGCSSVTVQRPFRSG